MTCIFRFHTISLAAYWEDGRQEQRLPAWSAETSLEAAISGDMIGAVTMTEGMKKGRPNNSYYLGNKRTLLIIMPHLILR